MEIDPYAASVLVARQNDGRLTPFPIWDDVSTFDGRPWRGCIDVISGGFPCQDISSAGKGAGIDGARSGLWSQFARIIREVRPRYAFVENSQMLVSRGLGRVLGNLSEIGYDAVWTVLGADDVGAPHVRKRIWILAKDGEMADADGKRRNESEFQNEVSREALDFQARNQPFRTDYVRDALPDAENERSLRRNGELRSTAGTDGEGGDIGRRTPLYGSREWWSSEPRVGRVADGVANRVDRLRCIGNGQVPLCAATAFRILYKLINK